MEWKGLDPQDARRILQEEGENLLPHERAHSTLAEFLSILSEPMLLILLAGGILYFLLGNKSEGTILLFFVLVVLGMAFFQKQKTQNTLEALRQIAAPRSTVIRGGLQIVIPAREVVRGDILMLSEGDRVPADARLLDGRLFVDESLLTGESVPVLKIPGADTLAFGSPGEHTSPFIFAGTMLTQGMGVARAEFTGERSAVGRIGLSLSQTVIRLSPMEKASLRFVRVFSLVGVAFAGLEVFLFKTAAHMNLLASLLGGVAFVMAFLPEEIPVILTIFFALGARRLSAGNVLVRRMSALGALGEVTVLAVDKTGTLTENRMQLVKIDVDGESFGVTDGGALPEAFHPTLEYAILASSPASPDPMEKALFSFGEASLSGTEHLHRDWRAVKVYGLEPPILAMARVYEPEEGRPSLVATKGSPESVLDLCHIPPEETERVEARVRSLASQGYRVLGVAFGTFAEAELPVNLHDVSFTFLGLLAFQNRPRPEVEGAIRKCHEAGIRVVMMTGDHPETALAIAREVGIPDRTLLTGSDLDTQDERFFDQISQVSVCARLRPEQKLRLVSCLSEKGEIVAMTGDGVNDAPALRAAHVGIAMGQKGTDTAREAAALVLLKDSFADLVGAIQMGRRIEDNIASAVRFAVAVHLPLVFLGILTVVSGGAMILTPVDILLLQFIIDPACSLLFEAEPERAEIMREPPRPTGWTPFMWQSLRGAVFQGMGVSMIFFIGYMLIRSRGWPMEVLRTVLFLSLAQGVLLLILSNRNEGLRPTGRVWSDNPVFVRLFSIVPVFLLLLYAVPPFRESLGWGRLSQVGHVMGMVGLVGGIALYLRFFGHVGRWTEKSDRSSGRKLSSKTHR